LGMTKLDKSRDGAPGLARTILGRRSMYKYVYSLVEDMWGKPQ